MCHGEGERQEHAHEAEHVVAMAREAFDARDDSLRRCLEPSGKPGYVPDPG
jgi:hypothetical protein